MHRRDGQQGVSVLARRMKQSESLLEYVGDDVELSRRHLYIDNDTGDAGPVVPGSVGARLVDGLHPVEQDQTVIKKRYAAGAVHCSLYLFVQWLPRILIYVQLVWLEKPSIVWRLVSALTRQCFRPSA